PGYGRPHAVSHPAGSTTRQGAVENRRVLPVLDRLERLERRERAHAGPEHANRRRTPHVANRHEGGVELVRLEVLQGARPRGILRRRRISLYAPFRKTYPGRVLQEGSLGEVRPGEPEGDLSRREVLRSGAPSAGRPFRLLLREDASAPGRRHDRNPHA